MIDTAVALAGAALAVSVLALLLALWAILRTRLAARHGSAQPEMPSDIVARLEREGARIDSMSGALKDLQLRVPTVEQRSLAAVQRVGVVRFNPFEDTGGQQSFALAMLDDSKSGIVISSLHSRQQTRVYLKQIDHGRCETALSEEETEALRRAGIV